MSEVILSIDPGNSQSAWLLWDNTNKRILHSAISLNEPLLRDLRRVDGPRGSANHLAIEMVESFGMAVGKEVFETVFWIGRFVEAWDAGQRPYTRITRKEVKMHLCGSMRAKDTNIRQALLDKFGEVGTVKNPGPLFGVKKDIWSALAVAVTYTEKVAHEESQSAVQVPRGQILPGAKDPSPVPAPQ